MKVDASNGQCELFSFKDGVLSRLGHDVKLRVGRFELEWDGERLTGWFDPASIETVCAMRNGAPAHGLLSGKDMRKIEKHVRKDILHVNRYPRISFRSDEVTSDGDDYLATGKLQLHGTERTIRGRARRVGDQLVCEVELHQPDFGIQPFRALLGALRLRPEMRVRLTVPAPSS